jgi:uncharacterized protein YndB with AHSA1/START domain
MDTEPVRVTVTRAFSAPAERVFAAWLDPENAGRWLFATDSGTMVRVAIEPRVDGHFEIVERREGEDVAHLGRYLELQPPTRLRFSLQVPKYSEDIDEITVQLEPLDTGCRLTLTHLMNARWAEYADRSREGWAGVLDRLAACLE